MIEKMQRTHSLQNGCLMKNDHWGRIERQKAEIGITGVRKLAQGAYNKQIVVVFGTIPTCCK